MSVTATVAGSGWFLPFWIVMRAVPSGQNSTSFQVRAAASERRRPPSAITPTIARSMAPRARAAAGVSMRPTAASPGKAGGFTDACQCLGRQRVCLPGCLGLVPPTLDRLGHDWMAGGVLGLGYFPPRHGRGRLRPVPDLWWPVDFPSAARWPR